MITSEVCVHHFLVMQLLEIPGGNHAMLSFHLPNKKEAIPSDAFRPFPESSNCLREGRVHKIQFMASAHENKPNAVKVPHTIAIASPYIRPSSSPMGFWMSFYCPRRKMCVLFISLFCSWVTYDARNSFGDLYHGKLDPNDFFQMDKCVCFSCWTSEMNCPN